MTKRIAKIVLVLLMVIGFVFALSNILFTELHAKQFPVVKYLPEVPDCKGDGDDCIDMTGDQ